MAKSTTDLSISCSQSGTDFAGDVTQALIAVNSCHRSATEPTYNIEDGVLWLDTSSSDYVLRMRLGGAWVILLDHDGSAFETSGQAAIKTTADGAIQSSSVTIESEAQGTPTGGNSGDVVYQY